MIKQAEPLLTARRVCFLNTPSLRLDQRGGLLDRVRDQGFDAVLLPPVFLSGGTGEGRLTAWPDSGAEIDGQETLRALCAEAEDRGLALYLDLALDRFSATHPLAVSHPWAFEPPADGEVAADPRVSPSGPDDLRARLDAPESADLLRRFAAAVLMRWASAGVRGVRVLKPHAAPASFWHALIEECRAAGVDLVFIAETEAAPRAAVLALAGCGFAGLTSSLAWWDGRARWFVEEYESLRAVAPLIAVVEATSGTPLAHGGDDTGQSRLSYEQRLALAAATGTGLIVATRSGTDAADPAALEAVRRANALSAELSRFDGEMRVLTGEGATVTALLRADAPDVRRASAALLVLINPSLDTAAQVEVQGLLAGAGADFVRFERVEGGADPFTPLQAGEVRLLLAHRGQPIALPVGSGRTTAVAQAEAHRLVIEAVTPTIEGGSYPVRRIVGERVTVEADIFADGHEQLSAELLWGPVDSQHRVTPMEPLGNDRWRASFPLERLGRYAYAVEAWLDVFAGFRRDYAKKREAGVNLPVDAEEGLAFVDQAAERASGALKAELKTARDRLGAAGAAALPDLLLAQDLAALMRRADARPFRLRSPWQVLDAERLQAGFASWYELFPRSQTDRSDRHGTFDDVIARLPAVRAMGFDVLYFPPIHPIGRKNRKGRNNSLTPSPNDPGSPYAIGSAEGGHEAIHAELGTLDDFRRLVAAAAEQGLEIALDFAIQCSPDHPWLTQHPGWFDWRPDGSIKYAENPPKKYQDIVNVDFYKPDAVPDLWLALRDIVLLWVGEGVRLFRVDNPHTKPLPFWEWMIGEVRGAHPDVVFLAEAFTRPKLMYRLAKIGFSQSYTYFTWRHTKQEFIDYLTELTQTAPKEFFRPHFFVNTPDINPPFLQSSGRGGFLIRAALAATLSGLWGVYSGFELLESDPVPGKEEYKDSEKYEIKPRDWTAPGNIIAEISQLNRIRKGHPALHTHLGVVFLPAWNDQVLVFAKATAGLDDVLVVAINLDPHSAQDTGFELPLWSWGIGDEENVEVEDLIWEQRFTWTGKVQSVRLDPAQPYAIWSLRIPMKATS